MMTTATLSEWLAIKTAWTFELFCFIGCFTEAWFCLFLASSLHFELLVHFRLPSPDMLYDATETIQYKSVYQNEMYIVIESLLHHSNLDLFIGHY